MGALCGRSERCQNISPTASMRSTLPPSSPRTTLCHVLLALTLASCSDDDAGDESDSDTTASLTSTGTSGTGTSGTGTSGTGTTGGSTSGGGSTTTGGAESNDGGFTMVGLCGFSGEATVSVASYEGWEEYYLIGDEGYGAELCLVRYPVTVVADTIAPDCPGCLWAHVVEYGQPQITANVDGVCADSELGLTAEVIASYVGRRLTYGASADEYGNGTFVVYAEGSGTWESGPEVTQGNLGAFFAYDGAYSACDY